MAWHPSSRRNAISRMSLLREKTRPWKRCAHPRLCFAQYPGGETQPPRSRHSACISACLNTTVRGHRRRFRTAEVFWEMSVA